MLFSAASLFYGLLFFNFANNDVNSYFTSYYKKNNLYTAKLYQRLDSVFLSMVKENHFNGCILIAQGSSILYSNCTGYADFQSKKRINSLTRFELASVSKQFTAIAILQLFEQGKLKLTDSVQQYIPTFPYSGVSISQLLCHRSGVPDYFKFADKFQENKDFLIDNDSLERMLEAHFQPLTFPSGTSFNYSNTGYATLALIVEKISGQSFPEYVKRFIFEPAGMKNTCFYDQKAYMDGKNFAFGHKKDKKVYQKDYLSGIFGDKGIFSTVNDLFLYNNALDSNKLLKEETKNMAFEPHNLDLSQCNNYGYGWRLDCDKNGSALVYHGGLWNGNNTLFIKRLDDNVLIIFLSNIYNRGFAGGRSDLFLQILDEERL
ncbi:MAG: beta-lactamase family protein [Bacteroidales bacterium]|jgi:CubicO group peptidase (beta-lactamase class C family)|nr:beta-lactamase family protein [Bacteroidales bacterium]